MEHKDFRILGLAGSLRRASFHRGIVRAAHEVAPEWMSCENFDLARIPYFNQDLEDEGNPESVKELSAFPDRTIVDGYPPEHETTNLRASLE
jgi:hypothetical protein